MAFPRLPQALDICNRRVAFWKDWVKEITFCATTESMMRQPQDEYNNDKYDYEHRPRRKQDITDRDRVTERLLSQPTCFFLFLGAAGFQAFILIMIGSVIDWHSNGDLTLTPARSLRVYPSSDALTDSVGRSASILQSILPQKYDRKERSQLQPLDNYYSRMHMDTNDMKQTDLPILIVGGSDGSGTRAFVDTLGRLGVPLLVDDEETLDIHAEPLYQGQGWPGLVKRILNETHSLNYNWDDLSESLQSEVTQQMQNFERHYSVRAARLVQGARRHGTHLPTGVRYGFKAPVSMTLLPLLQRFYGRIKFIHVVRDGRDVSLSSNKSPVHKFYDVYYPDAPQRRALFGMDNSTDDDTPDNAFAMQLWSQWNTELLEWERINADGDSFDFLVARTEDLLNNETRHDLLLQLADFVGSPKTQQDICCLSERPVVDMGASAVTKGDFSSTGNRPDARKNRLFGFKPNPMKASSWTDESANEFGNIDKHSQLDHLRHDEDIVNAIRSLGGNAMDQPIVLPNHRVRRRRLTGIEPDDEIITRLKKLNEEAVRTATQQRMESTDQRNDSDDSMIELVETERERQHRGDKLLSNIKDPAMKKRFSNFMQQHNNHPQRAKAGEVKQRYGKWVEKLKDKPELSALLHREGSTGLQAFGYYPEQPFMDRKHHVVKCQACRPDH